MVNEDYKGYTIKIDQDDMDTESPLEWTTPEERGTWFVMHHNDYSLPMEIDVDLADYNSWEEVAKAISGNKPYRFVRWFEHSGIAVSLRDDCSINEWDAGIVGVIIGNTTVDINNDFKTWQYYIEGEIYQYGITAPDGEHIDSLGDIYGYEQALDLAKEAIDYDIALPKSPGRNAMSAASYHN